MRNKSYIKISTFLRVEFLWILLEWVSELRCVCVCIESRHHCLRLNMNKLCTYEVMK